jgi:hypothetical protein
MMTDMAAPGDTQQTYPVPGGSGAGTAWPETGPGLRSAVSSSAGTLERRPAEPPVDLPNATPEPVREPARDPAPDADDSCPGRYASPQALELALCERLVDSEADGVWLSAVPGSAARARRLTMSALESWGLGGHGEAAVQLVAELVANAVRYTGGRTFGLRLVRRHGCVRIEVRDPSRALPCLILGDVEDEGGRGLQVVDSLSQRWGADLMSHGKSVWCELRIREAG